MFGRTGHGGGIIKRKLFLPVLLLVGLALVFTVNSASATYVSADHTKPKVNSVNPTNNGVITKSKPIKVTFSEKVKFGNKWIELKSLGGSVKPTTKTINGKTLTITPKTPLAKGVRYKLILHSGSVKDLSGNGVATRTSKFTVSDLSTVQMKDGIKRVQNFYNTHNRLPNYVNYGTKKIPIAQFQKIIAKQGLKIKTHKSSAISKAGTVKAYGWNSCSKGWFKTGGTFVDYCPFCHSYGTLVYNPKHTYEGEWTCSKCDSDFCNCGRCKATGSQVYLTKA